MRHNENPIILAEKLDKPSPLLPTKAIVPTSERLNSHHSDQRYITSSLVRRVNSSNNHPVLFDLSDRGGHRDDCGSHLMEVDAGPVGVPDGPCSVISIGSIVQKTSVYGDNGSDSGVSSLRSASSGDERSGSRSSAFSADDTTGITTPAPARVWHVQSVQHTSLMMAHPGGPAQATTQPINTPNTTPLGYPSPAGGLHPPEMLWRPSRYSPLTHSLLIPAQPTPEELLERERHERMIQERREAEAREMDKQDREREAKLERERREEARVAEQAVHKHFQESLRLAHQKRSMQSAIPWNSYITLPSSGSRNHQGPPLQHTTLTPHSGHLYPGVPTSHPVSAAPQQQQQREREERDARERERDAQTRERDREHLAAADRLHRQTEIRDHTAGQRAAYYSATNPSQTAQQVLRPSSVPIKVEYPPPPAHSRTPKSSMQGSSHHDKPQIIGTTMPKAEPNVSLFSYSGYQPPVSYMHDIKVKTELGHKSHTGGKSLERDHHSRELLPNPPPLLSDQKSSVIVKNERNDHQKISHSSSPKMMSYSNVQQIPQQHKTVSYEYKNPTQSPHHLHHLENLQTKGGVSLSSSNHHRQQTIPPSNLPPSSHGPPPPPLHSHNRQSPLTHPHLTTHPLPSEPRYLNRSDPSLTYTTQKSLYPYPHPPTASTTPHYPLTPNSKPKVSSPAPPHIYGKPNSGIMTGTPVCRASEPTITLSPLPLTAKSGSSPYQQVLHLHGTAPQQSLPPPPAHSSRSAYESRYPNALSANKLSSAPIHSTPATVALTPRHQSTGHNVHHSNTPIQIHSQHITTIATTVTATTTTTTTTTTATTTIPTLTTMMNSNAMQTQPLDLGIERSSSPKRKADTGSTNKLGMHPVPLEIKKRKIDEPIVAHSNSQIPQIQQHQQQPQTISTSVTETSSFFVSTAMTTVTMAATNNVNSVMMPQQATPSKSSTVSVSPAPRTASGDGSLRPSSTGSVDSNLNNSQLSSVQLSPTTLPSPVLSAPGTPAKQGSITDTEKSNSPAPRPPSTTNYPVHKLKKAWLQRHSGEDGTEDTTGVVGSGSCVTLPLNISQTPSQPINKERESTASVTGSLPSAVNSIHNIGSMAVNSINKSKVTGKSGRKPTNKEVANGHTSETKNLPYVEDCSSSSDPEKKAPPKKKLPKVKRKKGAARKHQVVVEDQRRRKEEKQAAVVAGVGSDSSNDSEAGSASDASEPLSSIIQTMSRRNPTTTNCSNTSENGNSKEPRKRGRRPKAAKGNDNTGEDQQPRQKKERRDDSNSNSGNGQGEKDQGGNGQGDQVDKKPTVAELKKSGDSWVQDDCCGSFATRVVKCRECRMTPNQRRKNLPKNIFCRFYEFRKMRYTKNAQLAIAGFCDPKKDASEKDMRLWLPGNHKQPVIPTKDVKPNKNGLSGKSEDEETTEKSAIDKAELDLEMAHRLLSQVGDHFCDLFHQEKNTFHEHVGEDGTVAWKRVIQGVRELCDVCETTLFNYHWVCGRCGFVVCIDCYKDRKNNTGKIWGDSGKDRDDYSWLLCGNRMTHEPERLMLTQIIAGDGLLQLGQQLHDVRAEWGIPQHCSCTITTVVQSNELLKNLITGDSITVVNGNMKQLEASDKRQNDTNGSFDSKKNSDEKNSPLTWLADVALQSQDKNDSASDSDSDEDREGNYSTLRELLIRPSSKTNGNGSRSNSPTNNSINTSQTSSSNSVQNNTPKVGKKSKMDTLDEVISSVIEHSVNKEKDSTSNDEKPRELKHFVRRYKWTQRGREPLPIRIMTLTESKSLYPDVPHSWLCDGKLLKLNDPNNVNNYRIFQDQWKRGQPVIVSDVSKALKMDLWHPDAFARDFGDEKNDLINCMTGNLVPNQPMRKFWEGFEHFSKRLKDDKGNPMLLKLKDWPPADDFAELLPTRFSDLMKALPLSEYTHRNGRLNLASRLPECFVRPDLGPKMYNAYGSAIYPSKGTTNLHLDISDAVNVMVYVGIPKDGDNDEHVKEALKAIDEAGCDILTRRRVRDRGEAPGALWHIYAARDADKIRDLLNAVALEKGARLEPHHDPIHDQSCYLDGPLRERLYKEYGVEGYAIVQCLGDAVFVPAGAPHQVRNLHNCIKVAEDFVSPENISHCFHLTQEFRALSDAHTNHEDKLQIKNIIYHAVKDSLTILANAKEEAIRKIKIESTIKKET